MAVTRVASCCMLKHHIQGGARVAKTRTAEGRTRVIATLDDELVTRIDELTEVEGKSRSGFVEWMLSNFISRAEQELIVAHEIQLARLKLAEATRKWGPDAEETRKASEEYVRLSERAEAEER